MNVVIPAAGRGTRFAGMNLKGPKEMLPLGGQPVIGHALAESARAGFDSAFVVVSPSKQQLAEYVLRNCPLPVEVVVQPEPLGVGDTVLRCWQGQPIAVILPDDVVLGADHWTKLLELHRLDGTAALCVRPVPLETTHRFGIAECIGDCITGLVEKPPEGTSSSNLAVFGRYVVTEPVIAGLRSSRVPGELQLTYGFAAAVETAPGVRAVLFSGEIYDCGTPSEYASSIARFPAVSANADHR